MGINTIRKLPVKIAEFLRLDNPSTFTADSFCRSSATLLENQGERFVGIKHFGGWKFYILNSVSKQN